MDDVKAGIQYVFQTKNALTLALSATGHAAMEAVMVNMLERDDVVLIANNGIWGERAGDMATRAGENRIMSNEILVKPKITNFLLLICEVLA